MPTINVPYEISWDAVQDLLIAAFEGGYSPWISEAELLTSYKPKSDTLVWWGTPGIFGSPLHFALTYQTRLDEEGEFTGKTIIDRPKIKEGLEIFAEKYPRHWQDVVNDDTDASTGDVLLQCIVFGEIIYG